MLTYNTRTVISASDFVITRLNNRVGVQFYLENYARVSNSKLKLIVVKDISLLANSFYNNVAILNHIKNLVEKDTPRMLSLHSEIKPHITMLNKMILTIEQKFSEIQNYVDAYNPNLSNKRKRAIFNFLGNIVKPITGNLDSEDGEYYGRVIQEVEDDEKRRTSI